mmetsp:Transcript_60562/g.173674  ORF Transcript_60562/g.173674 Transcript_60562/m.173674 type:complete len:500 (+) Transcript_60562:92-1591(+)
MISSQQVAVVALAQEDLPRTVHVVGRPEARENSGICGEYTYVGVHGERAAYQRRGSNHVIFFAAKSQRWIMGQHGFQEGAAVNAYADDCVGLSHPGHAELMWQVWESSAGQHIHDPDVVSMDAMGLVSVVGRATNRIHHAVCGEYALAGVHHGRPLYQQKEGEHEIKFYSPDGRWLISPIGAMGNQCHAFSDGPTHHHPGTAEMVWHFFEPQINSFQTDLAVRSLPCPLFVHVIGRSPSSGNSHINGTYQAVGAVDGRPMFLQPGTSKLLRYSARGKRWLIQCEGLAEPSLLGKLYHWLFSGGSIPEDRCNAFAEDCSAPHPGFCELQWQVFEDRSGSHKLDTMVRSTTAPLAVKVCGRDPGRENGDIVGDYMLCGTHCGRPAYMKQGTTLAIRYWPPAGRWIIDVHGLRNTDCCSAFVDDLGGVSEDPTCLKTWQVYAKSRGCHVPDPSLVVLEHEEAPRHLPAGSTADERHVAQKHGLAGLEVPEGKRLRRLASMGA